MTLFCNLFVVFVWLCLSSSFDRYLHSEQRRSGCRRRRILLASLGVYCMSGPVRVVCTPMTAVVSWCASRAVPEVPSGLPRRSATTDRWHLRCRRSTQGCLRWPAPSPPVEIRQLEVARAGRDQRTPARRNGRNRVVPRWKWGRSRWLVVPVGRVDNCRLCPRPLNIHHSHATVVTLRFTNKPTAVSRHLS